MSRISRGDYKDSLQGERVMEKSYLVINKIEEICNYQIHGNEKVILILKVINDWRDEDVCSTKNEVNSQEQEKNLGTARRDSAVHTPDTIALDMKKEWDKDYAKDKNNAQGGK